MELLGSCTANHVPGDYSCHLCKGQNFNPIQTGGTPFDYSMDTFYQPHQDCLWQQDIDNDNIKSRSFLEAGRKLEPNKRPAMQTCEQTEELRNRQGNPPNYDGIPELPVFKDANVESDLIGLWGNLSDCRLNKGLRPVCTNQDNFCRFSENEELQNQFNQTSINHEFYQKQNFSGMENKFLPHVFRNNTKSKIQR